MEILIFDMDGVLLEPIGYHQALKKTVQLAGSHLGLDDVNLTQDQIHRFESVGISSEWHSSALCMAFLKIQLLSGVVSPALYLEEMFANLQRQPIEKPPIERGLSAIELLCFRSGVDPQTVVSIIRDSEDISRSFTMQWLQELVLGTEVYQSKYQLAGMLNTTSYLKIFDRPLLSPINLSRIADCMAADKCRIAIMTNRPSSGPQEFSGSPEAEMGAEVVQLSGVPLIGYGEIAWLAEYHQSTPGILQKPHSAHALAAILGSISIEKELCLTYSVMDPARWPDEIIRMLQGSVVTVFEDTPVGLLSVQSAGQVLNRAGIEVSTRLVGIGADEIKRKSLEIHGAQVFSDINLALVSLNNFGSFA
jgi:hypothetical protein